MVAPPRSFCYTTPLAARQPGHSRTCAQVPKHEPKGIPQMATELRELRGRRLPEAIQIQCEEHQKKATRKANGKEEPLMTMPQWKVLLESNKNASSLPPTPVEAGLRLGSSQLHVRKPRPHRGRFCSSHLQPQLHRPTQPHLCRRLVTRCCVHSNQT